MIKQTNFENDIRAFSYHVNRLELAEIWQIFCRHHQCKIKGKLTIIDIIKANHDYSTTRQKKKYPVLLFKQSANGESYRKDDAVKWCYELATYLDKANKLQVV